MNTFRLNHKLAEYIWKWGWKYHHIGKYSYKNLLLTRYFLDICLSIWLLLYKNKHIQNRR